jgi:hypothetical protein
MQEHVFDFKVKVNFQNGNVSLTAPQIVTPPTYFHNHHQPTYSHTPFTNPPTYNTSSFVPYNPYPQYNHPAPVSNQSNSF